MQSLLLCFAVIFLTGVASGKYLNEDISCFHCHSKEVKDFAESVHYSNISCPDCHGGDINIGGQTVSQSAMYSNFTGVPARIDVEGLCSRCHAGAAEQYDGSIHKKELEKGVVIAATCPDCHGAHDIRSSSDPGSSINPEKVPLVCAKCHENQTKMSAWYYGIKTDRFDTYKRSYHYRALLSGGKGLATCPDCHESHDTKNESDPASPINPANLPSTCGKQGCHQGDSYMISGGKVHEGQSVYLLFFDAKKLVTYFYMVMIAFELTFTLGLIFLGITSKYELRRRE